MKKNSVGDKHYLNSSNLSQMRLCKEKHIFSESALIKHINNKKRELLILKHCADYCQEIFLKAHSTLDKNICKSPFITQNEQKKEIETKENWIENGTIEIRAYQGATQ